MKKIPFIIAILILFTSFSGFAKSDPRIIQQRISELHTNHSAIVSYLGPEGTYTQEACGKFFENKGFYRPYKTVNDAINALINKESNYAVIPQENTIGGAVIDYVDNLIAQTEVYVIGEIELPINQNLLAKNGTKLSDIKTVYSHKQGIAQGKDWLNKNIPNVKVIEVSSTAQGAKMVAESNNISCAAIASVACAQVYNLNVLAESIQNNKNNKTRFYVLSRREPTQKHSERLAFVVTGSAEYLPDLMNKMEKLNIKLVAIHDRPQKTSLGQYHYLIECSNCDQKKYKKLIENSRLKFRYLGSFNLR